MAELADARREVALRHQRQEPDEQGLSDERLQHPVAGHSDRLVRRAADGTGDDRATLLLICGSTARAGMTETPEELRFMPAILVDEADDKGAAPPLGLRAVLTA